MDPSKLFANERLVFGSFMTQEVDQRCYEEITDMNSLLLPDGKFPTDVAQFSVSYNRGALDGWVKQLSPCCAAASLSGAWNCIMGLKRSDPGAMQKEDGIEVLRGLMQSKIDRKRASLEPRVHHIGWQSGVCVRPGLVVQ